MALRPLLDIASEAELDANKVASIEERLHARMAAAEDAGYRVEALLEAAP
jgi:hypothetical protein